MDSLALCNAELNLKTAFRNFFRDKNVGYPKFKSRKNPVQSYTTNNQSGTVRLSDGGKYVRIPKMGHLRIKLHRQIPDGHDIKSATISRSATGKYHISILPVYSAHIEPAKINPENVLGLDYSSKALYVDHNGRSADYPKYLRQMESRLKKQQRTLSRRKKGGSNWQKQKIRVARLHEKVSNQRRDFLHKESRRLADRFDAIIKEDLNMRAISQTLSLGKATMDNGNGMFRTFLGYKLADHGKPLVRVSKWYPSSKLCGTWFYQNLLLLGVDVVVHSATKYIGGIVSFEVVGGYDQAAALMNHFELFSLAVSLGDTESLIEHPASMTHRDYPRETLAEFGFSDRLVRISAGLESTEDLIKDLEQALSKI